MNEPPDPDFFAKLNHELRSPLHSIYGFGTLLLKNKEKRLSDQDLYFVQRILENCDYLFKLIDTFLEFAKEDLESGGELQYEDIDLPDFVRLIFRMLEGQILEKPIVLETDIPENILPFRTDPRKLKIILINLISNAIKYTEKGKISARLIADPKTHEVQCVEIIDTGKGISKEEIGEIFNPFSSRDKSSKSKSFGLGLYIVKSFCRQLGYAIEVQSKKGEGSTFRIKIGIS